MAETTTRYTCHKCPSVVAKVKQPRVESRQPIAPLQSHDYLVLGDQFDFDNIGVSRPHGDRRYLSCADCDTVLGFIDAGLYYIATDLVKAQSQP